MKPAHVRHAVLAIKGCFPSIILRTHPIPCRYGRSAFVTCYGERSLRRQRMKDRVDDMENQPKRLYFV